MRHINEEAIDLIKGFEGTRLVLYRDSAGLLSIGTGHLVRLGEDFSHGITESEALDLLHADLRRAEASVCRLINVPLTDNQYGALVSFVFNVGGGALQRSTLRKKINRREYTDAANEFPKWIIAGGKRSKGLLRRRMAEAELYCKP